MFGDSWGPRLEHILRYTLLALLDRPSTTLLDISRLLTDKDFRKETLEYCKDVTVLQFWKHEFGKWNDKQVNESIAPVLNKVGAFTANPIIRNIIGQSKSSFDIRKIMDEGKILVVNLSKGLIGEDNAGILGSFLVTKVQLAAMSRSDIPLIEDRRPFYLYVDEFQNFATDSFSVILSEARKYGLNLTVANQYVAQMTDTVRDAVFGNVGTTISFRVSADDAPILAKQFEPTFEESDIIQLNNRNFVISMIINGEKVPAFSATTLSIPDTPKDNFDAIIAHSREYYARPRLEVETEIRETIEQSEKYKKELSDSGRQEEPKLVINTNEQPVFRPVSTANTSSTQRSAKTNKPAVKSEQKPNLRYPNTRAVSPQEDFRRQKLSPNAAEGKERLGLKDLTKLVTESQGSSEKKPAENNAGNTTQGDNSSTQATTPPRKGKTNKNRKNRNKKGKKSPGKDAKMNNVNAANVNNNAAKDNSAAPVKPEVEYQEKSTVDIRPSHNSLPLSTPVKRTEDFANKDNSVDGFLSIKH
jgi:hypothetical protein